MPTRACPSTSPPLVSVPSAGFQGCCALHSAPRKGAGEPSVWGHLLGLFPPVVVQDGLRARAQAQPQAKQAAGHHLLPGHWCQVQLVLPHWAGIIMPQLIFQRLGLSPLSFPLASSSGLNQSLITTLAQRSQVLFPLSRNSADARLAHWPCLLAGSLGKLHCDCFRGSLTHSRDGRILSFESD